METERNELTAEYQNDKLKRIKRERGCHFVDGLMKNNLIRFVVAIEKYIWNVLIF